VSEIKPGLRMKELVEATGVPKSTILHYVHEGLLPEPVKTSPNMAYYDPACVDRIRFIQHLQHRHRLSLADIRRVLDRDDTGAGMDLHLALNDLIFGQQPQGLLDRDEFAQAAGLEAEQVDELLGHRLLLPMIEGKFDAEDVAMGRFYARSRALGLRPEDATYYVELGEKIVDHEMAVRGRITRHLPYDRNAAVTMEMVHSARALRAYIIDRLFQRRVASMKDLKEDES
jgi:DNA-binding transcriptional MerR regulator